MDDARFRQLLAHRQLEPAGATGVYVAHSAPEHPLLRARWLELGLPACGRIAPQLAQAEMPPTSIRRRREGAKSRERRTLTDNLWSGCPIAGGDWSSITATWKVPAVGKGIDDPPGKDGNYWMYAWVGLDGFGENELLQVGVAHRVDANGADTYWGWYEWVPDGPKTITNWSVSPGHTVVAMVEYLKDPSGRKVAGGVSLANITNGQHFSLSLNPPAGVNLTGGSAEWIVEDPGSGYPDFSLALFTPITFTHCSCGSSDGTKRGIPGDGDIENILNSAGTQMTVVNSRPEADNFWVAYYKYNID